AARARRRSDTRRGTTGGGRSGPGRGSGRGSCANAGGPATIEGMAGHATIPTEHERSNPTLASVPSTRRRILVALKKRGEAGAEDLAGSLGITVSAVRQHLAGLG